MINEASRNFATLLIRDEAALLDKAKRAWTAD
jgi:hypothetical protein